MKFLFFRLLSYENLLFFILLKSFKKTDPLSFSPKLFPFSLCNIIFNATEEPITKPVTKRAQYPPIPLATTPILHFSKCSRKIFGLQESLNNE